MCQLFRWGFGGLNLYKKDSRPSYKTKSINLLKPFLHFIRIPTRYRNCSTLIKNTVLNSIALLQRSTSFKTVQKNLSFILRRCNSLPNIYYLNKCDKCLIIFCSTSPKCPACDRDAEMMNLAPSPCKNCSSFSLTPVEEPNSLSSTNTIYRNYDILNYDRQRTCSCRQQQNKANLVSLSNIKSYSCSVKQKVSCDEKIDGEIPKNVRTTASGINYDNERVMLKKENGYKWKIKQTQVNTTWTCKRCTLLNNPDSVICEACESPYTPDLNSNVTPSVIIKVGLMICMSVLYFLHVVFALLY